MDPVTDRQTSANEVLSIHRKFARSTARALETLVTPVLQDGKPLPDFVYVQELLAGTLNLYWHHLADTDEACHETLILRHTLIGERDAQASLLYREVVDLRLILRGRFGTAPSKNFIGLRGDTSRDPVDLLRQADRAVGRLRDRERLAPPSKHPSFPTLRARWATPVAEAADTLRALVGHVTAAVNACDGARLERKRALAGFNNAFVLIAGLFEAIYRATGRPDLAEAVRPSRRHPGKTYLQVKRAANSGANQKPKLKVSVTTRLIAPIRRIFDQRRSA